MSTSKYPSEIKINPNQGGKAAIERLVEAYGFTTRQALADHLEVSKSTLANRYMRDTFPSDWIIRCSIETGASLEWLSFGKGTAFSAQNEDIDQLTNKDTITNAVSIKRKSIIDGVLLDSNFYILDKALVAKSIQKPLVVADADNIYLTDEHFTEITDGKWVVEIEGKVSIKELIRVPVGKIRVSGSNPAFSFECMINDLKPIARCYYYLMKNIH